MTFWDFADHHWFALFMMWLALMSTLDKFAEAIERKESK